MALRAYWQQTNKHNVVDRIEIDDSTFSGDAIQLTSDATGFTFSHSEITSDSNDGLINLFANRIQVGKLDFRPRIDPNDADELSLLEDIRDGDNRQFLLTWKRDGAVEWKGYVTTRIFSYPEKSTEYVAKIRAEDFELLKGVDYVDGSGNLIDTRQTLIQTFSDLFSELGYSLDIVTATSWITEDTTDTTDFLSQIYHETKALREFAKTGDETDQPITHWDALEKMCAPMLLIKQKGGAMYIEQLTELADPTAVNETVYNPDGSVKTATRTVDYRQTGYTSADSGTPSVKVTSNNDSYPAMKRVGVKFDHRTKVSGIQLPDEIPANNSYSQLFISDGNQRIDLTVAIVGRLGTGISDGDARVTIEAGKYWWRDSTKEWVDSNSTAVQPNLIELTISDEAFGVQFAGGGKEFITSDVPADGDGTLTITFGSIDGDTGDSYYIASLDIINAVATENSTSINYQLTQDSDYPTAFYFKDSIFGDGPTAYSVAALRYSMNDSDVTVDSWQRRGTTTGYRNFHENALKESLDLQRTNTRKLEADIWGEYDSSKILDYDGNYYYYVGGSYTSTVGKWVVTLVKLEIQTGTDTFDDIPKFTDETGSGTGTTSTSTGGGIDQSTADARYLLESNNLSDLDSFATALTNLGLTATASELNRLDGNLTTVRQNLGVEIGVDVQGHSDLLDDISLAAADDGNFLVGNGTTFVEESGNTARTSLGLGTGDSPTFAGLTLNGTLTGTTATLSGTTGAVVTFETDQNNRRVEIKPEFAEIYSNAEALTLNRTSPQNITMVRGGGNVVIGDFADEGYKLNVYGDTQVKQNLYVQGGLFAQEFVVDQERTFFSFNLSPGGGKISSVSGSAGSEVITFEDTDGTAFVPVATDDIIVIQERTGLNSGAIVKSIRRKVASISGTDITLTDSGITWTAGTANDDVGEIAVGDNAVVKGNTTNALRDGYIEYIVQADMPYQSVWDEVSDVGGGFEAMRFGGMSGFDASITGDVGIAGATKTDGAVFWITEDEAQIGNFSIKDGYLTDTNVYIGNNLSNFAGADRMLVGNFNDGSLPIARVTGDVSNTFVQMLARSTGDIFNGFIGGDKIFGISSTEARFFGAYADGTDLWGYESGYGGDTSDKSNASVRLDFAEGKIFYDGMRDVIYSGGDINGYSAPNTDADGYQSNFWEEQILTGAGLPAEMDTQLVYSKYYDKPYGINTITMTGAIFLDRDENYADDYAEVYLAFGGQSDTYRIENVSSGTGETFELNLDVSGSSNLSGEMRIELRVQAGSGGNNNSVTGRLRSDIFIVGTT